MELYGADLVSATGVVTAAKEIHLKKMDRRTVRSLPGHPRGLENALTVSIRTTCEAAMCFLRILVKFQTNRIAPTNL